MITSFLNPLQKSMAKSYVAGALWMLRSWSMFGPQGTILFIMEKGYSRDYTLATMRRAWKASGIGVDVSCSADLDKSRPTICYAQGPGEETRFEHILEMGIELNIGHKQFVPAQHCMFAFGHPEQMIECLPRPIPVKNRIAS